MVKQKLLKFGGETKIAHFLSSSKFVKIIAKKCKKHIELKWKQKNVNVIFL